jgi:hypothetical protein
LGVFFTRADFSFLGYAKKSGGMGVWGVSLRRREEERKRWGVWEIFLSENEEDGNAQI